MTPSHDHAVAAYEPLSAIGQTVYFWLPWMTCCHKRSYRIMMMMVQPAGHAAWPCGSAAACWSKAACTCRQPLLQPGLEPTPSAELSATSQLQHSPTDRWMDGDAGTMLLEDADDSWGHVLVDGPAGRDCGTQCLRLFVKLETDGNLCDGPL